MKLPSPTPERKKTSEGKLSQSSLQAFAVQLALLVTRLREVVSEQFCTSCITGAAKLRSEYERLCQLGAVSNRDEFANYWAQMALFNALFPQVQTTLESPFSFLQELSPSLQAEIHAVLTTDDFATLREQYPEQLLLHLYEAFLAVYDSAARKRLGVWYTPSCIVRFMVDATRWLLVSEWGSIPKKRLQIIEPAAGTGAFLAEALRTLAECLEQQDVELHGFEILWPTYCIAQMNIALAYQARGGKGMPPVQFHLANSLLASSTDFAPKQKGITIVMGNPPYNRGSANKGEWITELVKKYKPYCDGKFERLEEVNIVALSDDYVKFIALAQHYVECSGEGIVAFITNKGYLDGIIHRQMRRELLSYFDAIYILNLHGDSRYSAKTRTGEKDENLFNIKTGVCISFFVKHKKPRNETLAKVYYHEIFGLRMAKEDFLNTHTFQHIAWQQLLPTAPYYYLVPKDFALQEEYQHGFGIQELFEVYSTAVETQRDKLAIQWQADDFRPLIADAKRLREENFRAKYDVGVDGRDWKLAQAIKNLQDTEHGAVVAIDYYPFDLRYTLYSKHRGLIAYPRFKKLGSMLATDNVALVSLRTVKNTGAYHHCFVTQRLVDRICFMGNTTVFPLYRLRSAKVTPQQILVNGRQLCETNFRSSVLKEIEKRLGVKTEAQELFDYVYAVLNSPSYCQRFEAFLKIDFPRVPYPTQLAEYRRLAEVGGCLRQLHLMERCEAWKLATSFPIKGHNRVQRIQYCDNRVYINAKQFFEGVNSAAWQEYIGPFQPAQKWLKERMGRKLSLFDIAHYQCILYVLEHAAEIRYRELNNCFEACK